MPGRRQNGTHALSPDEQQRPLLKLPSPWYRGAAQHALVWAAASLFLLLDDRIDTSLRASVFLAAGIAGLAALLFLQAIEPRSKWQKAARGAYFIAAPVLMSLLALHGAYVRNVGGLEAQAVEAVLQTDVAEAFNYFISNLLVAWAAFLALALLLLWLTFPRRTETWTRRWFVTPVLAVGTIAALWLGRAAVTEPIEVVESYRAGIAELREANEWWRTHPLPPASSDFEGTVIVILGESTSRHHMAIYGYPRDTTPRLSAIDQGLAVFTDVIATDSSTIEALVAAFTVPSTGEARGEKYPVGLFQLARSAGFSTTWLSNQNEFGVWDSPIRILAQQADTLRYHDPSLGKPASRRVFDHAMLPSLDRALAAPGQRKLVLLHMMATHLPYCWTKPPGFAPLPDGRFGNDFFGKSGGWFERLKRSVSSRGSDLNCYDNGVRYVDAFVGSVIDRAKRLDGPAAVLYFSDHGEAPLLATNHDGADHSAYHLEVPFVLWANADYRSSRPKLWQSALDNRDAPFSLRLLTPSLADLMAIRSPLLKPQDSLFSPVFVARQRQAIGGRIRYDEQSAGNDYRENARAFVRLLGDARGRVWAHRVNTLGSLLEAKRTFSGIEVDVHFNAERGIFEVRHEYPDIGVTLRDILEWSRDRPGMRLWIDWKNASPENVQPALAQLQRLDRRYGLRDRTLVETASDATSPALAIISRAGFRHGFYLPAGEVEAAMAQGPAAAARLARRIERILIAGRFDAVTYDAGLHAFVQAHLDRFLTERGIARYSWDLAVDSGDSNADPKKVAARVSEWKLDGLLVRFPSDFRI